MMIFPSLHEAQRKAVCTVREGRAKVGRPFGPLACN